MSRLIFFLAIPCLFLGSVFPFAAPARASEPLAFSPVSEDDRLAARAANLLENAAPEIMAIRGSHLLLARGELNADATPELFMRLEFPPEACPEGGCSPLMFVFVEREGGLRMVARFPAFRVRLSDSTTAGVRDLMAYDDPKNDYGWTRYAWVPTARRYEIYRIDSRALSPSQNGE